MIIPVRCFTCGKVIGNLWDKYNELVKEYEARGMHEAYKHALDAIGLKRDCCRRMVSTHVNLIDDLILYPSADELCIAPP